MESYKKMSVQKTSPDLSPLKREKKTVATGRKRSEVKKKRQKKKNKKKLRSVGRWKKSV